MGHRRARVGNALRRISLKRGAGRKMRKKKFVFRKKKSTQKGVNRPKNRWLEPGNITETQILVKGHQKTP